MKRFPDLVREQKSHVKYLRSLVDTVVEKRLLPNQHILGALLTGSVSRGDARVAPLGLFVDIAVVVRNRKDIDLTHLLGPDEKPSMPFHCITLDGNIGLAVELVEYLDLLNLRIQDEASIFAKFESTVLFDREGLLKVWKKKIFTISEDEIRQRSLTRLFRMGYLIGEYRTEKWEHREAWAQINQNLNEACECFCEYLHCINGCFVPRRDWLVYLAYEQPQKPADLESLIENLYQSACDRESVRKRRGLLLIAHEWMSGYAKSHGWV